MVRKRLMFSEQNILLLFLLLEAGAGFLVELKMIWSLNSIMKFDME